MTSSGPLSLFTTQTVQGGYVAAGTGLRNRGFGTIIIAGIPPGAKVKAAYLYWDILGGSATPAMAQVKLNGQPITGTQIASGADPCWGNTANFAFRAEVTSLVDGNGSYALSGFASGYTDARDPWNAGSIAPMAEGASLVVIYDGGAPSMLVQVYEGAAETQGAALTQTLAGFTAGNPVGNATTTFVGADGQNASEPGSTFNGSALPSVGWDGADPIAPPPLSLGNLWDTATVDVTALVRPGDTSATTTVQGGPDCLVWVAQVFAIQSGPALRPVLFVHGINQSFADFIVTPRKDQSFHELFDSLPDPPTIFAYYQDKGYNSPGFSCATQPLDTNTGSLYVDPNSISGSICDSKGALAYSSVLLDDRIAKLTGPVAVLAYSMGGAITRGWLDLAQQRGDSTPKIADTVIVVQGAMSGSYTGVVGRLTLVGLAIWNPVYALIAAGVATLLGFNPGRPAINDLSPASQWYQKANAALAPPSGVHYFTFYTDIQVSAYPRFFFVPSPKPIATAPFGDLVMLPGPSDPRAVPWTGGARFLPGGPAADRHEYPVVRPYKIFIDVTGLIPTQPQAVSLAASLFSDPAQHVNLNKNLKRLSTPTCASGGAQVTILDEMLRILRDPARACS